MQGDGSAFRAPAGDDDLVGSQGQDFALSIDLRVQGVLENELAAAAEATQAKGAVGIITDVQTGEVLGMASWPASNSPASSSSGKRAKRRSSAGCCKPRR